MTIAYHCESCGGEVDAAAVPDDITEDSPSFVCATCSDDQERDQRIALAAYAAQCHRQRATRAIYDESGPTYDAGTTPAFAVVDALIAIDHRLEQLIGVIERRTAGETAR